MIKKYNEFFNNIVKSEENMWDSIPDSVKDLHQIFKAAGKKLFVVGGSVRDFLNRENPKDFDLATDALPEEVVKIIGSRWRVTLQGKSFFVVVVYTEDQPKGMEIATFRTDEYGDLLGKTRNPEVKFSTMDKDAERRDITYNALYYDLDKRTIIDLVGGVEDMRNRVTKFVGNPDMRIKEDPLRIMRIFRFSTRYNFVVDEKTGRSIKMNKDQLNIITRNRIWEEMYKAYGQVGDYSKYLKYLNEYDMWNVVFPGSTINPDIVTCSSLEVYVANLFKNCPVVGLQRKLVQDYVIPDDISRVVAFLVWFQAFTPDQILDFYDKKRSYQISSEMVEEWIKVAGLSDPKYSAFLKFSRTVDSKALMDKGFVKNALGQEIKRLEIENFKKLL